jgi:hypothetical protein
VEAPPTKVRRLRETTRNRRRLQLRVLAGPALLRQVRGDPPRGLAERSILLVVAGNAFEDDDRVPLRRAVPQGQDREAPHDRIRIAGSQGVQQRAVGVDRSRSLARKQLEREQGGAAGRRALVLEAAAQELELLPETELADRPVGDGPLAEVGASRRGFELVVPLGSQRGEFLLRAGRRQLIGLSGR